MANTLTLTEHLAIKTYHRQQQLQQQQHHRARKQTPALQQTSPLCEQRSLDSAVDIIILLLVLGACGFLFTPYFTYVCGEVAEVLPATYLMIWEVVYQAPVAYAGAAVTMFVAVISVYEIYQYKARRCENPKCRGLRKAMELDIQLETEQCVKASALMAEKMPRNGGLDLGQDQKELEAELRRMAPPNGRAVLIFRAPCGCPAAHFEAWGSKKALRRSKRWISELVAVGEEDCKVCKVYVEMRMTSRMQEFWASRRVSPKYTHFLCRLTVYPSDRRVYLTFQCFNIWISVGTPTGLSLCWQGLRLLARRRAVMLPDVSKYICEGWEPAPEFVVAILIG